MTRGLLLSLLLLSSLIPSAATPSQSVDLHQLRWFVHVDMITAQTPMSFYEDLIAGATQESNVFLQGDGGPTDDVACCAALETVSVQTFGTSGDGRDIIDTRAKYESLMAVPAGSASGSRAFLVRSLLWCDGQFPDLLGCATLPDCDSNGNDDPDLIAIISMAANDTGELGSTVVHERGHNACLQHINTPDCALMLASGGGSCLSATECANYEASRTTTLAAGTCECHASNRTPVADGTTCTNPITGICSGGLCGVAGGAASDQLLAAGGPGQPSGQTPDDPLRLSGLSGGWADLGSFASAVQGLAYAPPPRNVVFGVTTGNQLITIDPMTGLGTATVGTVNGFTQLIALAFDPGPTSATGDDRLFALDSQESQDLIQIDPDTAVGTRVGELGFGFGLENPFAGLAYDSVNQRLYASSPAGVHEIDTTTGAAGNELDFGVIDLGRFPANSLAFSPQSRSLYLVGSSQDVTKYNVIDAMTLTLMTSPTLGLQSFTSGGLAAVPTGAAAMCGDGLITPPEVCDTNGNVGCPLGQTCNATCTACDTDGDGVADDTDNCRLIPNDDQRDTNGDGFGNRCDPDLDDSGLVDFQDLGMLKAGFVTNDPNADLDGIGGVSLPDLSIMKTFFFQPPGPGAIVPSLTIRKAGTPTVGADSTTTEVVGTRVDLEIVLDTAGLTFEGYSLGVDISGGTVSGVDLVHRFLTGFMPDVLGTPMIDDAGTIRNSNQSKLSGGAGLPPGIHVLDDVSFTIGAGPLLVSVGLFGESLGLGEGACPGTIPGCSAETFGITILPE